MGIVSASLKKLAEGRTEITTSMIAEAEAEDKKYSQQSETYEQLCARLTELYGAGQAASLPSYGYYAGMAQCHNPPLPIGQQYNPSPWMGLLAPSWCTVQYQQQQRCPYCGR